MIVVWCSLSVIRARSLRHPTSEAINFYSDKKKWRKKIAWLTRTNRKRSDSRPGNSRNNPEQKNRETNEEEDVRSCDRKAKFSGHLGNLCFPRASLPRIAYFFRELSTTIMFVRIYHRLLHGPGSIFSRGYPGFRSCNHRTTIFLSPSFVSTSL